MSLPTDSHPDINLEQQRKRAKDLLRAHRDGNVEAAIRIARYLPRTRNLSVERVLASRLTLVEAQLVVAREAGFPSWPKMKQYIEGRPDATAHGPEAVIDAAFSGNDGFVLTALERDPTMTRQSIYVAAAVADVAAV